MIFENDLRLLCFNHGCLVGIYRYKTIHSMSMSMSMYMYMYMHMHVFVYMHIYVCV